MPRKQILSMPNGVVMLLSLKPGVKLNLTASSHVFLTVPFLFNLTGRAIDHMRINRVDIAATLFRVP
ncbi:hypothetical protein Bca52824_095987 [Brassica carinata]|uniref:Uncharacterized protein n=1 Tax=Brassica carinata TaxID=52824 RepID=A0A8X7P1H8_BRACI|nr:hypothetical protein Bca52824_095987 [Brassica carinata]